MRVRRHDGVVALGGSRLRHHFWVSSVGLLGAFLIVTLTAATPILPAAAQAVATRSDTAIAHLPTPNPTCASEVFLGTFPFSACAQAWSNGITLSYTGWKTEGGWEGIEYLSMAGVNNPTPTSIQQSFTCMGPNFSVFYPLAPGEYAGETAIGPSTAGPANMYFDLTVGSAGSTPAPATSCQPVPSFADGTLSNPVVGMASLPNGEGYWLTNTSGAVSAHGAAVNYGSMAGRPLNSPIAHIVATPDGLGYWLVASDGGIFSFGDAGFFGSMGGRHLNAPIVDIAPTSDGQGYWLVASDGGIFSFGDAAFLGSMGGQTLNQPVVGISPDYQTGGYWEVASDGGIFAFGAPFFGSTGSLKLNKPILSMAATANGLGYWFVASDGGIFAFGDAGFYGSAGSWPLYGDSIVGMSSDPSTGGYYMVTQGGMVYHFNAPGWGSH